MGTTSGTEWCNVMPHKQYSVEAIQLENSKAKGKAKAKLKVKANPIQSQSQSQPTPFHGNPKNPNSSLTESPNPHAIDLNSPHCQISWARPTAHGPFEPPFEPRYERYGLSTGFYSEPNATGYTQSKKTGDKNYFFAWAKRCSTHSVKNHRRHQLIFPLA